MERRLLLEKLMVTMPQLATPTISVSGDTLTIEEVENAEYYDIYVDGVLEESVNARTIYQHVIVYNDTTFGDNQNKTMTILSYNNKNLASEYGAGPDVEIATAIISASTTEKTYTYGFGGPDSTTLTFDDYPTLTQDREIAENYGAIQFALTGNVNGVYEDYLSLQNMNITSDTVSEYQGE